MSVEIVFTILGWLFVVVVILGLRLDPRRLRAEAEAQRAYLHRMKGRDLDPVKLARRYRTGWLITLVVCTVIMIVLVTTLTLSPRRNDARACVPLTCQIER